MQEDMCPRCAEKNLVVFLRKNHDGSKVCHRCFTWFTAKNKPTTYEQTQKCKDDDMKLKLAERGFSSKYLDTTVYYMGYSMKEVYKKLKNKTPGECEKIGFHKLFPKK